MGAALFAPRMLNAKAAAEYLGYKTTEILDHIPVKPHPLTDKGVPKYDRKALDAWLDSLSGLAHPLAPQNEGEDADELLAEWQAKRSA